MLEKWKSSIKKWRKKDEEEFRIETQTTPKECATKKLVNKFNLSTFCT